MLPDCYRLEKVGAALIVGLGCFVLAACSTARNGRSLDRSSESDVSARAEALFRAMSVDEKVGQLFMVGALGSYMADDSEEFETLKRHVVENHVGGVIWFRSNVYETAVLGARLQRLAKTPLLFSADLESGSAMRFEDATEAPWAMAVAATGDPALAEALARATAREARALGVAQVYAPVADVNVDPDNPVINVRSFGEDPADVSRFVAATVKGLQEGGVTATLKHFPGHGDTSVDSHLSLPSIKADAARLDRVELVPFRAGLAAGARSVMVAHLSVPALDASTLDVPGAKPTDPAVVTPSTLSKPTVEGLLRERLGFRGLVVTDALGMGGVAAHIPPGEVAVRALLAGNDQLLKSPDPDAAVAAVREAVRSGRVPLARLDASVRRILEEKLRLGLFSERTPPLDGVGATVARREHVELARTAAARALTLVRHRAGTLPFRAGTRLLHVVVADEATLFGPAGALTAELARRVGNAATSEDFSTAKDVVKTPLLTTLRLDPRSTPAEVDAVVAAAETAEAILVSFFVRARSGAGKIAIPDAARPAIPRLLAAGKPLAAISFGSPYLLRDFPALETYLCAYGTQEVLQRAAARALFGETPLGGRLPVTIPGLAPRGTGLSLPAAR